MSIKTHTILVVDDEPNNFDVIASFLANEPFELLYANSAIRADTILNSMIPDLILLDVMMPEEDGISYCKRLRESKRTEQIPVLVVTALDYKESLSQCFEAGADDFLSKPVSSLELKARIKAHLRLLEQLRNTQHMLRGQQRALNELQNMLTTALPHELRTPLTGILSPIQMIREECQEKQMDELIELIDIIENSGKRMHSVVERLLLYLHIESLKIESTSLGLPPENQANVEYMLTQAFHTIQTNTPQRTADFSTHIDILSATVAIPEKLLFQLFWELIDNACKFSEKGQSISIDAKQSADQIEVRLKDLGKGMSPVDFESATAFVQFDRRKNEQQGIGLGLAIANGVIDLIPGATLSMDPTQTPGTQIIVTFPVIQ